MTSPSTLHALFQTPNSAASNQTIAFSHMPTPPRDLHSSGEPAAVILVGAVAAKGFYIVGKSVANRLAESMVRKEENVNENDNKSDLEDDKVGKQVPIDDGLSCERADLYPPLSTEGEHADEAEPSCQSASHLFQFWEQSTLNRIKSAKQRRSEQGKYSADAVDVWYQATMGRYRQEKERRMLETSV